MSFLGWLGFVSQGPRVGAIDVVAVRRNDECLICGPFHVRVNKGNNKTDKRIVKLKVNGKDSNISMKLGAAGEAFFIERTREKVLKAYRTSPISSPVISPITLSSADPLNELPSFELPSSSEGRSTIEVFSQSEASPINNTGQMLRDRSYSVNDVLKPSIEIMDDVINIEPNEYMNASTGHMTTISDMTGTASDDAQRIRSFSDMSKFTSSKSHFMDASTHTETMRPIDRDDTHHSIIPMSKSTDMSDDTHRGLSHPLSVGEPSGRSQGSSWTWSWGEIPVKAKAKSSMDLYAQGFLSEDHLKAEGKDKLSSNIISNLSTSANASSSNNRILFPLSERMEFRAESPFIPKSRSDNRLLSISESFSLTMEDYRTPRVALPKDTDTTGLSPSRHRRGQYAEEREGAEDADASHCVSQVSFNDNVSYDIIYPMNEDQTETVYHHVATQIVDLHLRSSPSANVGMDLDDDSVFVTPRYDIHHHMIPDPTSHQPTSIVEQHIHASTDQTDNLPSSEADSKLSSDRGDPSTNIIISKADMIQTACTIESTIAEPTTITATIIAPIIPSSPAHHPINQPFKAGEKIVSFVEHQYNPAAFLHESEEIVNINDDSKTDGDLLSLLDIPLEDISPGPAGGDLYESDTDSYHSISQDESEKNTKGFVRPKRYRYRKVLIPSQDQIQVLSSSLHDGKNEILYEVEGPVSVLIRSELFVWPEDAKIVVIDVEGGITSNRKGSVWTSFLGGTKNAIHHGVLDLLNNISSNGYHILYIAQNAAFTKDQLEKLVVGTGSKLPPGPFIHSPECLMAGNMTMIRSDIFKAAVLRGLKSLFPAHVNPYYACFGTKESDLLAFNRAGVPEGRIFIVDQISGELRSANRTLTRSFSEMNKFLNEMFPPVADAESRKKMYGSTHNNIVEDTYADFNYWRLPPPDLFID